MKPAELVKPADRRSVLRLIACLGARLALPSRGSASALVRPRAWFTDIAPHSQFTYRSNNDFTGRKYFPQPMCGRIAAIDYDNDGFMDLVVTSLRQKPRILINNALEKNHWLLVDLRGKKSNRDTIGATVKLVTASDRALWNHVNSSVGFMSSSDRQVHSGLGTETKIDHLEIHWPSGIVQRIDHPASDQILRVEEAVPGPEPAAAPLR
jgi:hypothetical protein